MVYSLRGRNRKHSNMLYTIKDFTSLQDAIQWRDKFVAGEVEAKNLYPTRYTGDSLEITRGDTNYSGVRVDDNDNPY